MFAHNRRSKGLCQQGVSQSVSESLTTHQGAKSDVYDCVVQTVVVVYKNCENVTYAKTCITGSEKAQLIFYLKEFHEEGDNRN